MTRSFMPVDRQQTPERRLEAAGWSALRSAADMIKLLGPGGVLEVKKNTHGDMALRADIMCEEAVIKEFSDTRLPIRIHSEEHGQLTLNGREPEYLVVLDGLDGTAVYREGRTTGRYGTMVAIYQGADPRYRDYLWCGIIEHAAGVYISAVRDAGARRFQDGDSRPSATGCDRSTAARELGKHSVVYVDEAWPVCRTTFTDKLKRHAVIRCLGSSAMHYADVVQGKAHLALECTRKGNLEIAVAYGLIREAGGAFVDRDGRDLGPRRVLGWGMSEHLPVIAASSAPLVSDVLVRLG